MRYIFSLCAASAIAAGIQAADKDTAPKTEATAPDARKYKNVDAEAFDKLRKEEEDAVLLDVRTKKEYDQGHIAGSVLLDIQSADFEKEIAKLDKSKTYLVHCAAGVRSANACKKMGKLNFSSLYNLEGGMGAWEKAGKPVEKEK